MISSNDLRPGITVELDGMVTRCQNRRLMNLKPMQYLYEADGSYCFMDTETYEQIMLNKDQLGDKINFLKEEMECTVMFFNGSIIGVDIPNSVELKVVETEPGIRGDTATGGSKPEKWKQDILFLYRSLSTKVKCSVLIHVQAHISNV